MNIDTSWSKLASTVVGKQILHKMDSDPRLHYHNGDHVRRMYEQAKLWRLPYDVNLDASILGHDCVYDEQPNKEVRSAEYIEDVYNNNTELFQSFGNFDIQVVIDMILSTTTHNVHTEGDNRLIKLDLAELGDPVRRVTNFWNIHQENKDLYDINSLAAARGSVMFLEPFLLTMMQNHVTNHCSNEFVGDGHDYWTSVVRGIDDTILMSKTLISFHELGHA